MNLLETPTKKQVIYLLLLITLFGGLLRLVALDNDSFNNDELATLEFSSMDSARDMFDTVTSNETHPPTFYLLEYWIVHHIGNTERDLRMPSVIAGTLAVLLIGLLAFRWYGPWEGIAAALLAALFIALIQISRDARSYSMLTMSISLMMLGQQSLWLSFRQNRWGALWAWVAFAVGGALTAYLHYIGLVTVGLLGLFTLVVILVQRQRTLRPLLPYLLVAVLYIPWMPYLWHSITSAEVTTRVSWMPMPSLHTYARIAWVFLGRSILMLLAVGGVTVVAIVKRLRRGKDTPRRFVEADLVLVVWILLPLLYATVYSFLKTPILHYRPMYVALPAVIILLVRVIHIGIPSRRAFLAVIGGLAVISLLELFVLKRFYSTPQIEQFRGVAETVVQHEALSSGEVPVYAAAFGAIYFDTYFERMESPVRVQRAVIPDTLAAGEMLEMIRKPSGVLPDSLWLIAGHLAWKPEHVDALREAGYHLEIHRILKGADARLFVYSPEVEAFEMNAD